MLNFDFFVAWSGMHTLAVVVICLCTFAHLRISLNVEQNAVICMMETGCAQRVILWDPDDAMNVLARTMSQEGRIRPRWFGVTSVLESLICIDVLY